MKNFLFTAIVLSSMFPMVSAKAGIFGRRWSRPGYSTYYSTPYSTPAYSAPAAQPVTARGETGYRAYSYQPVPVEPSPPNPDQPAEFQQFSPAYGYPTQQPRNETGEPYHDAGFKIRGF